MLICKDAITAVVDGATVITAVYDRVYLEFGPNDAVENFQRKGKTKSGGSEVLSWEGKPWVGTRPSQKHSVHSVQELFDGAVTLLAADPQKVVIDGVETVIDPNWTLLSLASSQYDTTVSRVANKPKAAADPEAVVQTMAKAIMAQRAKAGKPITLEQAVAKARLLMEDEA